MIDFAVKESTPQGTKMPDLKEFMTTQEASEKLDLTIRAVNRLVANSKLEGI